MEKIFKKSFLEGFASADISMMSVISALLITLLIGVYIFFVYRILTRKTFYSKNFNIALVGVALVTAAIIVTIQSSIVVSLGMVGALSIVRFRTAIKDPIDLVFLFWAISVGIICGAGFAIFAVLLSVILTIAMVVLNKLPISKAPQILVVNSTDIDSEKRIMDIVKQHSASSKIKSRNMTSSTLDMTIEIRSEEGGVIVKEIVSLACVSSASILSHDGEVTF